MAKRKKQTKPDTSDRHLSPFMVRLPEVFRTQLRKLCETTRRTVTTEIVIALEKHLAENSLWPPAEE